MKSQKKKEKRNNIVIIIILIIIIICAVIFFKTRSKLQVVSVISKIEDYDYYIESNATKAYSNYYKELEIELANDEIDDKHYAKLVTKLFISDYYSLNNKITNQDIGGIQFIHSKLKDKFILESSNTIYKYIKNNLYGTRKQKLPEVSSVDIKSIESIKYQNGDLKDNNGYKLTATINYVKNYDYPDSLKITLIHENNKLVIVEFE